MVNYYTSQGYSVTTYPGTKPGDFSNVPTTYDAYICFTINRSPGAHYFTIRYDTVSKKYVAYNFYSTDGKIYEFDSFDDIMTDGIIAMLVFGIDDQNPRECV